MWTRTKPNSKTWKNPKFQNFSPLSQDLAKPIGCRKVRISLNDVRFNSWKFKRPLTHLETNFIIFMLTSLLGWYFLSTKFLCTWDTYNVFKIFLQFLNSPGRGEIFEIIRILNLLLLLPKSDFCTTNFKIVDFSIWAKVNKHHSAAKLVCRFL